MLTKEQFLCRIAGGVHILDGATGSNLMLAGMPKGSCTEKWILENPEPLVRLQTAYADAGCQIIYAPTFQAQPIALEKNGVSDSCEEINAKLVALSRKAAPNALIAGDLATLAAYTDAWDPEKFDLLVENYQAQIHALIEAGADLIIGETLLYPQEGEAILTAAELEGGCAVMLSYTMQGDGSLLSGMDAGPLLQSLEEAGAAAVGFNCVAADEFTPGLVSKLRRYVHGPLICKPNAGNPVINSAGIAEYPLEPDEFARIIAECRHCGAALVGGCCGTTPEHMKKVCRAIEE